MQFDEKSSRLQSKTSQGIHRRQAASELMARPPKPTRYRSSPNPKLNRLRDESLASQHEHSIHVIDSRTKTLSTRHPDSSKTSECGAFSSKRPVPLPKGIPTQQAAPVPKPRKSPVRGLPISKPRNTALTTKEIADTGYAVYEDMDKDDSAHNIMVQISRPEDKYHLAATHERNFTRELIPPALPPKNISKVMKEDKELPPLPPRSISAGRHHPVANNRGYGKLKDCVVGKQLEPVQDDEVYEPLNFDEEFDSDESDSESQ